MTRDEAIDRILMAYGALDAAPPDSEFRGRQDPGDECVAVLDAFGVTLDEMLAAARRAENSIKLSKP